jgi:hypothetical protein
MATPSNPKVHYTFDQTDFEEFDNVKICDDSILFDRQIMKVSKKAGFFFLMEDKDRTPRFKLYYRDYWDPKNVYKGKNWFQMTVLRYHNQVTCYMVSDDGVNFRAGVANKRLGNRDILLCQQSASHNFSTFFSKNKIYYGVGGRHFHKASVLAHEHPGKCLKSVKYIKWKLKNNRQITRTKGNKKTKCCLVVSDKVPSKCKLNGLHLYRSHDGKKWQQVKSMPIISGLKNGVAINSYLGYNTFDSICSVVYVPKKDYYILYTRANPLTQRRYISYCTSKDLIHWTNSKYIKIEKSSWKTDSFYSPYVYLCNDIFVGFHPHCVIKNDKYIDGGILLTLSKDGVNFKKRGHFFDFGVKGSPKPTNQKANLYKILKCFPVGGSLITDDNYLHQYLYLHSYDKNVIERYKIRTNGFTSLRPINPRKVCRVRTKCLTCPTTSSPHLNLNYKVTGPEGYVCVEILDEKMQPIEGYASKDCDKLEGNYVSKEVRWNNKPMLSLEKCYIRFIFYLARIHCFSFGVEKEVNVNANVNANVNL